MLRIYNIVLEMLRALRSVIEKLRRVDPDLARQLTRCSSSLALNLSEGSYSQGRNRSARYHVALGSAREVLAVLEVADAFGYFKLDEALAAQLNRIIGTLVKVIRG
jgi:four helix bundle protein